MSLELSAPVAVGRSELMMIIGSAKWDVHAIIRSLNTEKMVRKQLMSITITEKTMKMQKILPLISHRTLNLFLFGSLEEFWLLYNPLNFIFNGKVSHLSLDYNFVHLNVKMGNLIL